MVVPSPLEEAQVLVPVLLPDPAPLPSPLERLRAGLDLVVVGVYEVRKQTAVGQARDQFGEEAEQALERWLQPLRGHGGRLESRLVFSQTPLDTIERIGAEEADADVLLLHVGDPESGREARQHHLIVLGASDPGDPEVVLGELPRHVTDRVQRPVLVARRADGERGVG